MTEHLAELSEQGADLLTASVFFAARTRTGPSLGQAMSVSGARLPTYFRYIDQFDSNVAILDQCYSELPGFSSAPHLSQVISFTWSVHVSLLLQLKKNPFFLPSGCGDWRAVCGDWGAVCGD